MIYLEECSMGYTWQRLKKFVAASSNTESFQPYEELPNATYDVFISYSSKDQNWVEKLKNALDKQGVKVWQDKDKIRPGDIFMEAIEAGLKTCETIILGASLNRVGNATIS
jgi:hypothetical protein